MAFNESKEHRGNPDNMRNNNKVGKDFSKPKKPFIRESRNFNRTESSFKRCQESNSLDLNGACLKMEPKVALPVILQSSGALIHTTASPNFPIDKNSESLNVEKPLLSGEYDSWPNEKSAEKKTESKPKRKPASKEVKRKLDAQPDRNKVSAKLEYKNKAKSQVPLKIAENDEDDDEWLNRRQAVLAAFALGENADEGDEVEGGLGKLDAQNWKNDHFEAWKSGQEVKWENDVFHKNSAEYNRENRKNNNARGSFKRQEQDFTAERHRRYAENFTWDKDAPRNRERNSNRWGDEPNKNDNWSRRPEDRRQMRSWRDDDDDGGNNRLKEIGDNRDSERVLKTTTCELKSTGSNENVNRAVTCPQVVESNSLHRESKIKSSSSDNSHSPAVTQNINAVAALMSSKSASNSGGITTDSGSLKKKCWGDYEDDDSD